MPVRRVCCCGPGEQEISIDSGDRISSTARRSKCEQCHVVSRRRKLKTGLFLQATIITALTLEKNT